MKKNTIVGKLGRTKVENNQCKPGDDWLLIRLSEELSFGSIKRVVLRGGSGRWQKNWKKQSMEKLSPVIDAGHRTSGCSHRLADTQSTNEKVAMEPNKLWSITWSQLIAYAGRWQGNTRRCRRTEAWWQLNCSSFDWRGRGNLITHFFLFSFHFQRTFNCSANSSFLWCFSTRCNVC